MYNDINLFLSRKSLKYIILRQPKSFRSLKYSILCYLRTYERLKKSVNAIQRRVMFSVEDYVQAVKILVDAQSELDG